ncbi:GntR family transcriptional regulator [Sphingomonas sp. QA11]|uniref:GntR family transcriptional regulator n=1 Tax=Sphingomonas sp. QA11 TaxID=2950605 RepID=UPI002349D474|nr:GntR family transcriptional regulator [Sphingomonas sp. QA11]WCM28597.1 GntR family transcriptional regulator [Sphingomonas sp. QA11]
MSLHDPVLAREVAKPVAFRAPMPPAMDNATSQSLTRKALDHVRDLIVRGELPPRSRIREKELCEKLGLSRTPLREALKVLATENLVELLPRRGARVSELDPRRLREHFAVIAMVEAEAARILCKSGTTEQIRDLRVIHDALKSAYVSHDPARYYLSNEQFHRAVVVQCGNRTLAEIHASLIVHLHRARHFALTTQEVNLEFAHDHDEIIEAIERRDTEAAGRKMAGHQAGVAEHVLAALHPSRSADEEARHED